MTWFHLEKWSKIDGVIEIQILISLTSKQKNPLQLSAPPHLTEPHLSCYVSCIPERRWWKSEWMDLAESGTWSLGLLLTWQSRHHRHQWPHHWPWPRIHQQPWQMSKIMTNDRTGSDKFSLVAHQIYGSTSYGPVMIDQRPIGYLNQVPISDFY